MFSKTSRRDLFDTISVYTLLSMIRRQKYYFNGEGNPRLFSRLFIRVQFSSRRLWQNTQLIFVSSDTDTTQNTRSLKNFIGRMSTDYLKVLCKIKCGIAHVVREVLKLSQLHCPDTNIQSVPTTHTLNEVNRFLHKTQSHLRPVNKKSQLRSPH